MREEEGRRREVRGSGEKGGGGRGERREVKKEEERVFFHQPASYTPMYRNLTVIKHSCMTIHTICRSPSL